VEGGSCHTFTYGGVEVSLPRIEEQYLAHIFKHPGSGLCDISIDDIVLFLDRVGKNWGSEQNRWRRTALDLLPHSVGYASSTISWDINFIAGILQRQKLYDLLDSDLGDAGLLDEFTRHKAVNRRCFPLGKLLNVLVGNVPIASFISILRSLATKNETICKLPSRDVVAGLCFANCIYETDPDNPVAKALTCAYWTADDPLNKEFFSKVDGVVVWGRGDTISKVREQTPSETPIIEFGPKRSMAIIDVDALPSDRHEAIARRIAYDVCSYDQEACFSVQQVFCIGKRRSTFTNGLTLALDDYLSALPPRELSIDERYHVARGRANASAYGDKLHFTKHSAGWTVVETSTPRMIFDHPLCRTVYVHWVTDFDAVLPWIDKSIQTVSYEPYDMSSTVVAKIAAAGADRIVRSGRHGRFRPGVSQDGIYGMNRLVRWVSWERDLNHKYRFMTANADEDERNIYYNLASKAE